MGDAQVAHDQASTAMQYSSIGYDAVGVSGGANASNDMNMYAGNSDGSDAHADSSQLASYSSNFVEANTSNADPNSNVDQTSFNPLYAADSAGMATIIGAVVSHDPTVVDPKQTVAYDSAKNTSLGETPTEGMMPHSTENGHGHLDGGVMEQQYEEAPAISSEEDRLWTIVKANSLDFNAWTALIQETEKVAEDNVLKIRRVYDAFLAEFPLCYGYWKKYADHEARLGSVDKIVEVYERAVLAVTYSVDIWLHYCTFAMSAYEDPDTIRSICLSL